MTFHVVPIKGQMMISPLKEQIINANQDFGWTPDQTASDFKNAYSEYYCLVEKEILLGYIGLHRLGEEATINMIYIRPKDRGKGLGKQLLAFTLDQLQARQVHHLFLEVRASNRPAIGLYRGAGFDTLTIRKAYYRQPVEDALIMQLNLRKEN